jgi:hypothetical protein
MVGADDEDDEESSAVSDAPGALRGLAVKVRQLNRAAGFVARQVARALVNRYGERRVRAGRVGR